MRKLISITDWLPNYQRSWLGSDLMAGATVWAVLVPTGLAYSLLIGLDPVVGLYTIPLALVAYAIFGGSRLLVVGPDAAVAVLAGATLAEFAVGYNILEAAALLTLIVAAVYFVFYVLRLGWIADLIPDPVLKGVLEGIVWLTILKQLPKLLGVYPEGNAEWFVPKVLELVQVLPQTHWVTAVLGFSCVVLMVGLHKVAPRLPGPLIVLIASILLVGAMGLGNQGVAILGETSGDAFKFGLPGSVDLDLVFELIPGALAIVVLGYTAGTAALKRVAEKTHESTDPDQELLAFGMANLGSGLSGGYAIAGSMSKTQAALMSGAGARLATCSRRCLLL